jgi:hypothetical protein
MSVVSYVASLVVCSRRQPAGRLRRLRPCRRWRLRPWIRLGRRGLSAGATDTGPQAHARCCLGDPECRIWLVFQSPLMRAAGDHRGSNSAIAAAGAWWPTAVNRPLAPLLVPALQRIGRHAAVPGRGEAAFYFANYIEGHHPQDAGCVSPRALRGPLCMAIADRPSYPTPAMPPGLGSGGWSRPIREDGQDGW